MYIICQDVFLITRLLRTFKIIKSFTLLKIEYSLIYLTFFTMKFWYVYLCETQKLISLFYQYSLEISI